MHISGVSLQEVSILLFQGCPYKRCPYYYFRGVPTRGVHIIISGVSLQEVSILLFQGCFKLNWVKHT